MASMKLMLGHSEDYVSVLSYGLVHTVPTASHCHPSSSVSCTAKIKPGLFKNAFSKEHKYICIAYQKG